MTTLAQQAATLGYFPPYTMVDTGIYSVAVVGQVTAATYATALAVFTESQKTLAQGTLVLVPVSVTIGTSTGTAVVVAGSTIISIVGTSNQDQFVSNVAISTTTLTVTLKANATATNNFNVVVMTP